MRVYLKKRHIRILLGLLAFVLVFLGLLKLVSWWDGKQGAVDPETVQTTAPADGGQTEVPETFEPEQTAPQTAQTDQPVEAEPESETEQLIAEVYALRDSYVAELEAMYAAAEAELTELAKQEDNAEAIAAAASAYLAKASDLEAQCDGQIDTIVAQLQVQNGGDPTLIDTLIETYTTEKANKKAWYIARLEEKGLIS